MNIIDSHGRPWDSEFDTIKNKVLLSMDGFISSTSYIVVAKNGTPLFGVHKDGVKDSTKIILNYWNES